MRQWIVVAFVALTVAACTGDDDGPEANTAVPTHAMCATRIEPDVILTPGGATLTPHPTQIVPCATPVTPSPTESPNADRETGLASADREFIDRVVALQQAGDWDALDMLVGFTPLACTFGERGMSLNPPCREGETEGQLVDAFAYTGCGGGAWRPGDWDAFIQGGEASSITSDARFFGAIARGVGEPLLDAEYYIVFESLGRDPGTGFWFAVRERQIVAQTTSCGGISGYFGPDPDYLMRP